MEDTQFDRLTQHLSIEGSRRRLLGGIVAATAVGVTSETALEAKGKGKGKSKRYGAAGVLGKTKVDVCHLDDETGRYTYLEVPRPAMKGHQKHGDVLAPNGVTDCDALNEPEPEA